MVVGGLGRAVAGLLPLLLAACAGLPKDVALPVDDTHEKVKRHVMAANQEALRPAATFVKKAIPAPCTTACMISIRI